MFVSRAQLLRGTRTCACVIKCNEMRVLLIIIIVFVYLGCDAACTITQLCKQF